MTEGLYDTQNWAEETFGHCDLGDPRRVARLIKAGVQMANRPDGSLPDQFETWGELKAVYRLFNEPDVTYQKILEPHCRDTRARGLPGEVKLLVSDTTELDYSSLLSVDGLGQIGNGNNRGLLLHTALMLDGGSGRVEGIAAQEIFKRRPKDPERTPAQIRMSEDRESAVWGRVIDAAGSPPPGVTWIHVCDRGADDIEVMRKAVSHDCGFVIRAAKLNRVVIGPDGSRLPLQTLLDGLPGKDEYEIQVAASKSGPARTAVVTLKHGALRIPNPSRLTPWLKANPSEPLAAGVVELVELNPPRGAKPTRWVLLTDEPVETVEHAEEVIGQYERRTTIEDYHKCLKTGCSVENRQMKSRHGLESVVAICMLVAVRLMQMKMAALDEPERPASDFAPRSWIKVLCEVRGLPADGRLTIRAFVRALAGLGGFLGRKGDGEPGWLTLWRGFEKLTLIIRGFSLNAKRCG